MMTAIADLLPDTGLNVTLKGTKLDGEMSYWGTLKTFFKDGSSSSRLIDGHRKVIHVVNIRLHKSREYFLSNYSFVPEPPTTTTTTTTTTTSTENSVQDSHESLDESIESVSAPYPVGNGIQADQSQLMSNHNNDDDHEGSSPVAKSVSHNGASAQYSSVAPLVFIVVNVFSLQHWAFH